jgi:hypothetical protein
LIPIYLIRMLKTFATITLATAVSAQQIGR